MTEHALYRKVSWRLIPILLLSYVVAYLDRINIGFAKLHMLNDLHFSDTVFGLGAGIFFIGYFLFEVPSNIAMSKVGARVWIARIMISWGIISAAMAFVTTPESFYILRFLLGVAEAGFFPGIILYLTYWYPSKRRGQIYALFMTGVALSGVIGGPLSGWILENFSTSPFFKGWQWLFVIEAIPSVLIGIFLIFYLDNSVSAAKWLTSAEKELLLYNLEQDCAVKTKHFSLSSLFCNGWLWLFSLIYFSFVIGLYGIGFWLPTIINGLGIHDDLQIGLLSAIPYFFSVIGMVIIGKLSDKKNERRWHVAIPSVCTALGFVLSIIFAHDPILSILALTIATVGIMSVIPLFWSIPTTFLGASSAAAGIAMINSIGNLAGFVSPYIIGYLKDVTHSINSGIYFMAFSMLIGGLLTLCVPKSMLKSYK